MWTLRQDQMDTFERYHLKKFEDEMVEHLEEFAPRHWEVIGEETGREVVRLGIKQAAKYGFTNRGPVRFYIEMMFMFGSFFDTDPQYPWIAEILNDPGYQMFRADRLYEVMTRYWAEVAGPENNFTLVALRKMSQARIEDYVEFGKPLDGCLLRALQKIYPQKCQYLGEAPLRALLKKTLQLADSYNFKSSEAVFLMTALAFFFGHECTRDPLLVRIRKMLADIKPSDTTNGFKELRNEVVQDLRYALNGEEGIA